MKRLILALALALACVRPAAADRFTQLLLGVDTTPTPSPVCIMSPTGICAAQLGTWNIGTSTWTPAGGGGGGGGLTVGTTTIASGTNGYIQYNNGGLLGEKATTGTGNVVLSASPTFSGTIGGTQVVPYSALVNIGANTVLGQVLAGTPTQLHVPSCSGTGQALNWTAGGGFGCATTSAGGTSAPGVNAVATCGVAVGGSIDQSTKINSCLATYSAVSFPCGTFYTTNPIIVASGQSIFGGGPYCTNFNISSTSAPAIHVTPTPFNVTLRDFAVLRTGTPTSGATGILVDDCNANVQIDHIWITGQQDGISLGATAGGNAQFIVATENYGNGFVLTTSASCAQPMQWNLLTTTSTYNDGWGYYTNPALTGGDVAILLPWINANSFANTAGGFGFLGTAAHPIHGVSLYNCVSSTDGGVNGGQIVINSGSGHTIKGCYIELPGAGTTGHATTTPASNSGYGISLTGSNGIGWISIQNNNIANTAYAGISIASNTVYSLIVSGNMIHDPGWAANNTYDGIVTTSSITNGIISGNTVDHNASAASNANIFRNGINVYGNETAISITGNVVQESGSYGLFFNNAPGSYGMTTGNIFSGAAGGCAGTGYAAASNYHIGNVGGAGC